MSDGFWDIKITDVLALIVSIITLILAGVIYKNFDVKKAHVNKQLDTVMSLIQEINNTLVPVSFWTKTPSYVLERMNEEFKEQSKATLDIWHFTLFRIALAENKDGKFKDIYLSANVKEVFPFLSYINNPLLPKSIAAKLNNFYCPFVNYGSFEKASEKHIEIRPAKKVEHEMRFQHPDFIEAYKSWDNFILAARELKDEIEKWLKKYGSEDINFNQYLQHPKM